MNYFDDLKTLNYFEDKRIHELKVYKNEIPTEYRYIILKSEEEMLYEMANDVCATQSFTNVFSNRKISRKEFNELRKKLKGKVTISVSEYKKPSGRNGNTFRILEERAL